MSNVTDIILITAIEDGSGIDGEHPNADLLIGYLQSKHPSVRMAKVDGYAGGGKSMQCDVFMAAVNYLDVEGFVEAFRFVPWEFPESAQLMLKEEHDDQFTMEVIV